MESAEIKHIECTPGTCGGAPRVAGTRIRVSQAVPMTEQGRSPDEIVAAYPHLTLAGVYAALAYYHDCRASLRPAQHDPRRFASPHRPQSTDADESSLALDRTGKDKHASTIEPF